MVYVSLQVQVRTVTAARNGVWGSGLFTPSVCAVRNLSPAVWRTDRITVLHSSAILLVWKHLRAHVVCSGSDSWALIVRRDKCLKTTFPIQQAPWRATRSPPLAGAGLAIQRQEEQIYRLLRCLVTSSAVFLHWQRQFVCRELNLRVAPLKANNEQF